MHKNYWALTFVLLRKGSYQVAVPAVANVSPVRVWVGTNSKKEVFLFVEPMVCTWSKHHLRLLTGGYAA